MPPKKRRGAPARNSNALKHGLYARHFTDSQRRLLSDMPALESLSEIHMLRIGLEGVFAQILDCEDEDRKIKLYNALFSGTQRLLAAMRTQAILVGNDKELLTDFWNALALYQKEKGLL